MSCFIHTVIQLLLFDILRTAQTKLSLKLTTVVSIPNNKVQHLSCNDLTRLLLMAQSLMPLLRYSCHASTIRL